MSTPSCGNASPGGGGRTCFGMRAAQAAASSAVAIGFAGGGGGFATGAANFAGASGAFVDSRDVRDLHHPSVGEALLPQQRVLERRDHETRHENNQEHDPIEARVRRTRAGDAPARGAREGLAASRRSEHDSQFLRAPGAADLRALLINLTWRTSTWNQLVDPSTTRGPQTFVVDVQMLVQRL